MEVFSTAFTLAGEGRTALLGRSITVGISNGELVLGRFQSVIFAEFDGPRKREITVQVIGE